MPKIVDHDARRREMCDAVIRLAAEEGLAGASMRRVAAELGVSLGTVQHYFTGADDLLNQAFRRIGERRTERVTAELAALGRPPTAYEILRAATLVGVPLDEVRRTECLADAAYMARWIAGGRAEKSSLGELFDLFEGLLATAAAQGLVVDGLDPKLEARTLWALISSQAYGILTGIATGKQAVEVLDYWFGRVFVPSAGVPAPKP